MLTSKGNIYAKVFSVITVKALLIILIFYLCAILKEFLKYRYSVKYRFKYIAGDSSFGVRFSPIKREKANKPLKVFMNETLHDLCKRPK